MKRAIAISLAAIVFATACASSSADSCREYAAEVDALLASGADAAAVEDFINDTEEHVAKLISKDPDNAGPCADAIFTALLESAFAELEAELDDLTVEFETDPSSP